jgi:hypothetical protein
MLQHQKVTHQQVLVTLQHLIQTQQHLKLMLEHQRLTQLMSASAAAASASAAAASADAFDDVYLGSKSSDPTTDNDGDPLAAGMLYYNTVSNLMRIYSGSAWENVAVSTVGFASNGFAIAMAIAL